MDVDLVIAGGGPAGLFAALAAARAGMSATVIDPRAGTIDKACGEGLMPAAVARLLAVGVDPPGHALTGIRYCADGRCITADFGDRTGRGVRRTTLHDTLRHAVLAAGQSIVEGRVTGVAQAESHVVVNGRSARALLVADGLQSPLRRSLGLEGATGRIRRYGLRQHVAATPWTDHVEVHWAADAEAYVTPVGPDEIGVAVLTSARRPYDEHLSAFPHLRERLAAAAVDGGPLTPTSTVRGAGPLARASRHRVAGRCLLVGDASGYLDAITGEGLSLAFAQAAAAVAAVASDNLPRYERQWRRIVRRHHVLTRTLLTAASMPPVRKRIVPTAAAFPRVFSAVVNDLGRVS